jgi:hypothetical protein
MSPSRLAPVSSTPYIRARLNYPKDKEYRRVKVSQQLVDKIAKHVADAGLGPDDLLFGMHPNEHVIPATRPAPDPEALGTTEPDAAGRRYRHAAPSAATTLASADAGRVRMPSPSTAP